MTTRFRRLLVVVLASSLAILATACSSGSTSTAGGKSTTLTVALSAELTSFDVQNQNNGYVDGVYRNVFNYLVDRDNSGKIQPDLATSWHQVNDVTWHFTLRSGVKFQNGEALTADDVKFSLERVATDKTLELNSSFTQIKEVRVLDDLNLEVITNGPDPALLNRLSKMGAEILPKKYIDKVGMAEFSKKPVGTGPYQFVSMAAGDNVVLKKFPGYFGGDTSDWDKVVFRYVPEESTRVDELLTGGVDIATDIDPADWDRVNGEKGTKLVSADSTTVMALMVRSNKGPTADVRVRQAIEYAIDDKAIVNLFKGHAVPTRTRVTEGVTGSDESLFNTSVYDPDKARALLKEAGYSGGLGLTLQTTSGRNPLDSNVAQLIGSMLGKVGIHAKIQIMSSDQFSDAYNGGTGKDLMLNASSNSLFDANQALSVYHTGDGPAIGYSNPEVDDLLDKAAVELDPAKRLAEYSQVQQIVADQVPVIPLYLQQYFTGIRTDKVTFEPRVDRAFLAQDIHAVH